MSKFDLSTLWSSGHLVSHSQSPDDGLDWMIRAVTWHYTPYEWFLWSGLGGSYSKTSLDSFRAEEDGTLAASSGRWGTSGIFAHGGFSTRAISDSPNDASASLLSDILEIGEVPPRYFLSARAAKGILNRADKRLPPALVRVLREVAEKG